MIYSGEKTLKGEFQLLVFPLLSSFTSMLFADKSPKYLLKVRLLLK